MTKWLNGYTFNLGLMTDSCASLKLSQCLWLALYKCMIMWQTLHSYIGGQHSLPTGMLPHSTPSYASYERVGDTNHRNSWRRPCCHMEITAQEQWGTNPRVWVIDPEAQMWHAWMAALLKMPEQPHDQRMRHPGNQTFFNTNIMF